MASTLLALLAAAAAPPAVPGPSAQVQSPLIIDQNRLDRAPLPADRTQDGPAPRQSPVRGQTSVQGADAGVQIRGITFGGQKVPLRVANAAKPFLGKKATKETLGNLARALSDAYADADIALYTVVIPEQNFRNGVVVVRVAEGFVERVLFSEGMTKLNKAYALALTKERPLSRHTLERYLSLMRDIPGETDDVQLLRGTRPGAVILQIKAKRKHFDASLGFDNRGQGIQGNAQFNAQLHAFSLLRDGDRTDLIGQATPNPKNLRYISLAHTTPIGASGGTLSASAGYFATQPRHTNISGHGKTGGLTFAYPIIRGYKKNLTASLGIDAVDSDQAILGSVLSTDHTRALRGALGYSDVQTKSVFTAGLTVSRGLDILNAHGTPIFSEPVFTKVNARVTYDRQVGKKFVGRVRGQWQYSKDKLPAVERFVIGGADFGRAFDQAVLSGDRGYATLGEVAYRPDVGKKFAGSELYTFADYSKLHLVQRYPYLAGDFDLGSVGGGVRIAFTPRAWLELEGARVFDRPYPGYQGKWRFNVSWRLNLKKS
jgi:hemolysin activation/secretion protein